MSKFFIEQLIPKIKDIYEQLDNISKSESLGYECPDYCDSDYTNYDCEHSMIVEEFDMLDFKNILKKFKEIYGVLDELVEPKVEIKKEFYTSGELEIESPYVNGKIHGIEKWYYKSGQLQAERPYVEDKLHGIIKWYYETGELESETPYVDDKIDGIEKRYDRAGNWIGQTEWEKSKKVRAWRLYG